MSSINVVTENKQAVNWRYGDDFNYDNIRFTWRRKGYGHKIVVGAVDNAIGKGFNIIEVKKDAEGNPDNKIIDSNDAIQEIIETMWSDLKKTCYYERAYGKSLGKFFQEEEMIPIWRAYDTNHYFSKYDELGIALQYDITNKVGGTHAVASLKQIIDDDLLQAYEIILREDETKGKGLSILEPCWDTLFALSSLDEQGTYYAIRYGAGIRYMKIPEKKFTDSVFMSKIMGMLKGAIGANGVYALPYSTVAGVKEEFEIASENAVQIDFIQLRDLMLGTLSAQTGIPREIFLGSQIGLRSSEKNEDSYFDYLQAIQNGYKPFFKWVIYTLNSLFSWFGEGTIIDIEYVARETLDEEEKLVNVGLKIDIASSAGYKVPKEWLAKHLNIPLEDKELDPLGINAAINKNGEKDSSESEDTNDEDTDDEEEDDEDE